MTQYDHETAVAIFIRSKGVTRCPTACVVPTQGLPNAADQAALEQYVTTRNELKRMKMGRERSAQICPQRAQLQRMCDERHGCTDRVETPGGGPNTDRELASSICQGELVESAFQPSDYRQDSGALLAKAKLHADRRSTWSCNAAVHAKSR